MLMAESSLQGFSDTGVGGALYSGEMPEYFNGRAPETGDELHRLLQLIPPLNKSQHFKLCQICLQWYAAIEILRFSPHHIRLMPRK